MADFDYSAMGTMEASDVISSKLGMAYVIVNGNRYKLFQAKQIDTKYDKEKKKVNILGRVSAGNKAVGGSGTGKMTIYKNTDLFTKMILKYMNDGEDTYFDLMIVNYDPTSKAGKRVLIAKKCNIDGGDMASLNVDNDWLEEEVNFTYERMELPTPFTELEGMTE